MQVYSMHDRQDAAADNQYFPTEIFTGFNVFKIRFMRKAVLQGRKSNLVILSHINPVSYTHLDVYKRQPAYRVPVASDSFALW